MSEQDKEQAVTLETLQKQLKLQAFYFTRKLLNSSEKITPFFFYLLFFVEGLQILWFSVHPTFRFMNNPFLLEYLRVGLSYLSFENSIKETKGLLQISIIVAFSLIVAHVLCIAGSIWITREKQSKKKQSFFKGLFIKSTALQIIVFNTFLTIPIFQVSLIGVYCSQDSPYYQQSDLKCYEFPHLIYAIFSTIILIVILIQALYFWFMFYIKNPFSTNYFTGSTNYQRLSKFFIKIATPIYFIVDYKGQYQNVFIFSFFALLTANAVIVRFLNWGQYSIRNFSVQFFIENVIVWFSLNLIINYYLPTKEMANLIIIETIICSMIFSYGLHELFKKKQQIFLISNLNKVIKKNDMSKFMELMISIIFQGNRSIQINVLVCLFQLNEGLKSQKLKFDTQIYKQNIKSHAFQKEAIKLLIIVLQKMIKENSAVELKFMWIYLLYERGSRIICFHEIAEINMDKISVADQFVFYKFKNENSIHQFGKTSRESEDSYTKIQRYLQFSNLLHSFERQIEGVAKINQEFWEQLCEEIPSFQKVFNLAFHSNKKNDNVQGIFAKIEKIYPQSNSVYLYNSYLFDVGTNLKQKNRIEKKIAMMNRKTHHEEDDLLNKRIQFKANENIGVIHLGTTSHNFGVILNSNTEVKSLLGYDRSELVGQKVIKIMPKVYSEIHDNFIRGYLDKSDHVKLPVEKIVYAMKKDHMIIKSSLAVKIFPSATADFQLIGFFKKYQKSEERSDIMVNLKNLEVVGITQSFLELTNHSIKLSEINSEFLKLNQIFPELDTSQEFKIKEQVNTIFRFTDCTDKIIQIDDMSEENNRQVGEEVIIEFKSIVSYNDEIEVGILEVVKKQCQLYSALSLQNDFINNQILKNNKNIQKKLTGVRKIKQNKQLQNEYLQSLKQDQNLALQKKVVDFLKQNSYLKEICYLKVIFFIAMIALIATNISLQYAASNQQHEIFNLLEQTQLSQLLLEREAMLLTLTSRIFEIYQNKTLLAAKFEEYNDLQLKFENISIKLFEKASVRNQKLIINQNIEYELKTLVSKTGEQIDTRVTYIDALFQVIFLSRQIYKVGAQNFGQKKNSNSFKESEYFIRKNCEILLPQLGLKTTEKYRELFDKSISKSIQQSYLLKIGKSIFLVTVFILILVLVAKFNKFNSLALKIYNNILKWDIYQLETRCRKFMVISLDKQSYKKPEVLRQSELLRIIPKTLFADISKIFSNSNLAVNNSQRDNRLSINVSNEKSITNLNQRNGSTKNSILQSYMSIHSSEKITIKQNFSKLIMYFVMVFFILGFIGMDVYFFFKTKQNYQQHVQIEKKYFDLGIFTKNTLFTHYFGYKLLEAAKQGPTPYENLFKQELDKYYISSGPTQEIIGDPRTILKQIYFTIGSLNTLTLLDSFQNVTSSQKYIQIEAAIKEQILKIQQVRNSDLSNYIQLGREEEKTELIIKIVGQLAINLILFYYILTHLLKKLEDQNKKSTCLILILPIWLIDKNPLIKNMIIREKQEEQEKKNGYLKKQGARIVQEKEDEEVLFQKSE